MIPGGRADRGVLPPIGIVLACAAWLSLSPLPAEDAAAADEAPGAVALLRPADGAAVPAGRGTTGGEGMGSIAVAFAWHLSRSAALWYFVEVIALGQDDPTEVFTGYTRQTELHLRLDPGQYAWRVLAVDRSSARYSVSPWSSFTAGAAESGR